MIGIYKIEFLNGCFYIGQSVNIKRRISCHKTDMKRAIHKNFKIQQAYNEYKTFSYVVIEECKKEQLNELEQKYLDIHFNDENCYNIISSSTTFKGRVYTERGLQGLRNANRASIVGDKNPFYGKTHSDISKDKMSDSKKGKKFPKLSEAKKNTKVSEATKKLLSDMRKYGGTWRAKIVLDTQTGVFYSCAKEVSDLYNMNQGTFSAMLCGNRKNKTQFIYA